MHTHTLLGWIKKFIEEMTSKSGSGFCTPHTEILDLTSHVHENPNIRIIYYAC